MLPGDWLALFLMVPILSALTFGHWRSTRKQK